MGEHSAEKGGVRAARTGWGQRRQHRKSGHVVSAFLDHGSAPFWTCSCGREWRP